MKIVIPDSIEITEYTKYRLLNLGAKVYDDVPDQISLIKRIKDAEIITANYIDITSDIIDAAPNLKYIIVPAVGYEWVDYRYAHDRGIKVLNCPTYNSNAVAEYAIALMFALQRRIAPANNDLQSGHWNPKSFMGTELNNTKLGLVGYGKIGQKIGGLATAIGMNVDFVNSKSNKTEWGGFL